LNCSRPLCLIATLCFILSTIVSASAQQDEVTRRLALDIYKQLIEINTTDSVGSVTAAAEVMAKRFRDAGFPESDIFVLGRMTGRRTSSCACMDRESTERYY
jgi:hypothetical protein